LLDLIPPNKRERWKAEYMTPDKHLYSIDTEPINECPVSYIKPESKVLVAQLQRVDFASDATGTSLYGPDLSQWPAWAVESYIALQSEKNRVANAKTRAEQVHSKKPEQPTTED
jgi:hypothetical protein